ncbi:MAG: hypothetical protein AAB464_00330 [Patescibacteria group bacterium]|mgnify:FL=1
MAKQENIATQQFVDIEEIKNGTIILKNGSLRRVIMVAGINVELKSEEEQNLIAYSFQNFLNTLNFSVQLVIHSRKMNIENYLKMMKEKEDSEANELLKNQIAEYIEFIRSFVAENAVMAKTFFAVVPYDPIQISKAGENLLSSLKFWEKPKTAVEREEGFEQKIAQINQRTEIIVSGLSQIGLRAVPLEDEELIELFYNLYNPEAVEKKGMQIAKE